MALYRTHSLFNLLIALPLCLLAIASFFHVKDSLLITFIASFSYATLFMNPDVDLANKIAPFSLRGLLALPFRTYAKIFHHRGLSHTLVIGTLTRLIWLGAFILIPLWLFNKIVLVEKYSVLLKKNKDIVLWAALGIFLADCFHLLLDISPSAKRK